MEFHISFEDALDHGTVVDTFDNLEEARKCYDKWVAKGPEGYDIGVELIQDDGDDWESLDYHEWFTHESWSEAHPNGLPD